LGIIKVINQQKALMADKTLQSKVQKRFTLSEFKDSVEGYYKNMTGGKFILCPNFQDDKLVDGAEFEPFSINDFGSG
jgi:hypothetical protein